MFITKKHLSRRTLLRSAGASIALPLLDAMIPAHTAIAQTAAAPKPRMAFIYFPHGAVMDKWTPSTTGANVNLPQILAPLKPFQKYLTVVSGLENKPAIGDPVHAITPGTWLSCVHPRRSHDPLIGITADQVAAQVIGQDTPLPSLEISTEEEGGEGSCDPVYGCSYGKSVCFSNPSTPLPMEHNPRKLFQRLFGQGDTDSERKAIVSENKSILDYVAREAGDLKRQLGKRDQALLEDYLTSVREIERRVQKLSARDMSQLSLPQAPVGVPDNFSEHIEVMFDLLALAFQANMTRVASYMMAAEVSNQPYSFIGVPDAFHPLSHHQNDPNKLQRLAKLQTYHTEVFAKFIQKMADIDEGENTALENAIILYGSNMSDGNLHNNFPLPNAVVGGGCGAIKGNQHLVYEDRTPHANLLLTLLHRAGVSLPRLGDSSGVFDDV